MHTRSRVRTRRRTYTPARYIHIQTYTSQVPLQTHITHIPRRSACRFKLTKGIMVDVLIVRGRSSVILGASARGYNIIHSYMPMHICYATIELLVIKWLSWWIILPPSDMSVILFKIYSSIAPCLCSTCANA